ncbi:MAG TPA: T9SS type A sorting domain-containing protein [Bacteroidota bacterium]|nr:T9SS type A sorting domain-containing protein [Bacteroidota bacterium]
MQKKIHYLAVTTLLLLLMAGNVFAGVHDMLVQCSAKAGKQVFLNQVIMGDTLASGKRVDPDRVYVLQRGGLYYINDVIRAYGWDVNIKAQDSSVTTKPLVYGWVAPGTTQIPGDFIDAQGNVRLKNIVLNGMADNNAAYANFTYRVPVQMVAFSANGDWTLMVDSCIFGNASQTELRVWNSIRSVHVTNCIFGESGEMFIDDVGSGRALDIRKTACDTVEMVNNTFVNGDDRVFRHIGSQGRLFYFKFEHNTIVNHGGTYGAIALGKLGKGATSSATKIGGTVSIKNNLFVDPMAFGADTNQNRQWDFRENGEPYSASITDRVNMTMIFHEKEGDSTAASTFNVAKNYIYYTPEITSTWASIKSNYGNPTLQKPTPLSRYIYSKVADSAKAFIDLSAAPGFKNVPGSMAGFATWFLSPESAGGSGGQASGGSKFVDYQRHPITYYRDTLNCSYSTSSVAYTGGTDGLPVGDLNWFPDKMKLFTGVNTSSVSAPNAFTLGQNYPNPFNPSTQITYTLKAAGMTTLKVYNVIGQEVASLVNGIETAGAHEVSFNASRLSSGVYFYTLRSGNFIETKKMMLTK